MIKTSIEVIVNVLNRITGSILFSIWIAGIIVIVLASMLTIMPFVILGSPETYHALSLITYLITPFVLLIKRLGINSFGGSGPLPFFFVFLYFVTIVSLLFVMVRDIYIVFKENKAEEEAFKRE